MASADTPILTAKSPQRLAGKAIPGGMVAEVGMAADPTGEILFGSDRPGWVQGEVSQNTDQHDEFVAAITAAGEVMAEALADLDPGSTAIEADGLTNLAEYGTVTDLQSLAEVLDLAIGDLVTRVTALEP